VDEVAASTTQRLQEYCLECNRLWVDEHERWRAYIGVDDELLVYCPACPSREFDP
jgi:hypothetical protein